MKQISKAEKKPSRSLEHLPDLETSSTGSTYTLGARTNSHLAISDVWSVLDKIRQSYKVDKHTKEKLKQDRAAAIHKIGSGNSTTSSRTERSSIYTRATKLATLPIAESFNFADKFKPTIPPFKQVPRDRSAAIVRICTVRLHLAASSLFDLPKNVDGHFFTITQ